MIIGINPRLRSTFYLLAKMSVSKNNFLIGRIINAATILPKLRLIMFALTRKGFHTRPDCF